MSLYGQTKYYYSYLERENKSCEFNINVIENGEGESKIITN